MSAKIIEVDKESAAELAGICAGDTLLKIDGNTIRDVLDYKFYSYDEETIFTLKKPDGAVYDVRISKYAGQDAGLTFETYLMDTAKRCANKCVFCFIDQLPKNLRSTLYFKDDDSRMSFLLGNYISMTNLSEDDVSRMIKMRISPVNISIQTTNPELRCLMLGNKRAGESLKIIERFKAAGITMNFQIVVCPGLNDGDELRRSLSDLCGMYPQGASISIVPVGLTKFREGLYPLKPVDRQKACEIIDIAEEFARVSFEKNGEYLVYASDELYLKAGRELPPYEYYGEFSQLENGIGMMRLLEHEFNSALSFEDNIESITPFTVVTGKAAEGFLAGLLEKLKDKCITAEFNVYGIENNFFGKEITVAGLVVGQDIVSYLKDKKVYDRVLIPKCMLKHGEDVFLDDMHVSELEKLLGRRIAVTESDGGLLLDTILEQENSI